MRIPIGSRNLQFGLLLTAALIVPTFLWPEFWARTLSTQGFLPHGYCHVWPPSVIWLNTGSDLGIGVFYLLLAAILSVLLRRADREILFHWAISTLPPLVDSCIPCATDEYRCLARSRVAAINCSHSQQRGRPQRCWRRRACQRSGPDIRRPALNSCYSRKR